MNAPGDEGVVTAKGHHQIEQRAAAVGLAAWTGVPDAMLSGTMSR